MRGNIHSTSRGLVEHLGHIPIDSTISKSHRRKTTVLNSVGVVHQLLNTAPVLPGSLLRRQGMFLQIPRRNQ